MFFDKLDNGTKQRILSLPNDAYRFIFNTWKSTSKNILRRPWWWRCCCILIEYGKWSRWIQNFRNGRRRKEIRNLKEKRAWEKEKGIIRIIRKKEKTRCCK